MICISQFWHWFVLKLHAWQDLVAGVLAFIAGILGFIAAKDAIRENLATERRKKEDEIAAIRRSIAAEIFQFATLALEAHSELKALLLEHKRLTIQDVENAARFVVPVIYSNIGSHVGVLGNYTHDIILFFSRIQAFLNGVARLRRDLIEEATINREIEAAFSGDPKISALRVTVSGSLAIQAARELWGPSQSDPTA